MAWRVFEIADAAADVHLWLTFPVAPVCSVSCSVGLKATERRAGLNHTSALQKQCRMTSAQLQSLPESRSLTCLPLLQVHSWKAHR